MMKVFKVILVLESNAAVFGKPDATRQQEPDEGPSPPSALLGPPEGQRGAEGNSAQQLSLYRSSSYFPPKFR